MKKFIIVHVTLFLFAGCALQLAKPEKRTVTFIEQTQNSQNANYIKILTRISRAFVDSNYAIKVKDKESGTIVAKGKVKCVNVASWKSNPPWLAFNMTVNFKNDRVRILFEDLFTTLKNGNIIKYSPRQLTNDKTIKKAINCLDTEVHKMLREALNAKDDW